MLAYVRPQKPKKFKSEAERLKIMGDESGWISERKYRGIRLEATENNCYSSVGNERDLPFIMELIPKGTMLDGELITRDPRCKEGDVNSACAHDQDQLIYAVFDVFYYNNISTMNMSWIERRKIVEMIVKQIDSERIRLSEYRNTGHEEFYKEILSEGGEGLIMKKTSAPYKPGTRANYIKFKPYYDVDVVVVDAEAYPTEGSAQWNKGYRNLRYGLYDQKGELRILGSLGKTGPKEKLELEYVGKVAAVTCLGQFESGAINHIVEVDYRDDKDPKDCTFEFMD